MKKRQFNSQLQLILIPRKEMQVIVGDYVEGLARYLISKQWRATKCRGFIVVRRDIGTAYVFGLARFAALAVRAKAIIEKLRHSGLTPNLLGKLADVFDIHEGTRNEVVPPGRRPSTRAVVQKGGLRRRINVRELQAAWVPAKEIWRTPKSSNVRSKGPGRVARARKRVRKRKPIKPRIHQRKEAPGGGNRGFGGSGLPHPSDSGRSFAPRGIPRPAPRPAPSIKRSTKKSPKRKPNPAFMKPIQPDDKLATIVGSQPLSRPELTKKLWNYIKRQGVSTKKTTRRKPNAAFTTSIQPDDKLATIVGSQPLSHPEFTEKLRNYIERRGLHEKKLRKVPRGGATRKSEQETLRRTPHMDLSKKDPFSRGDKFQVSVYVDEKEARSGEAVEDVVFEAPPEIDEFPVTVHLSVTKHFAIKGGQSRELLINRAKSKSEVVTFKLEVIAMPKALRAGTIVAAFEYKGRPCGKVTRSVIVSSKTKASASASGVGERSVVSDSGSGGSRLELDANARQPDLTITILNPSNDGRNFDLVVTTPLLETYKAGVKGLWPLKDVSSEIVRGYFDEFTKDNISSQQRLDALLGAGEELFKSTPEHFRRAFWQIIDEKLPLKSIFVVSQEPFIPWELMIPSRQTKEGEDEVRDALGVTYSVGRWVSSENISPAQLLLMSKSQVIAPDYQGAAPKKLPHAQAEAQFVRSKFNGQSISPAVYSVFNAAMAASSATLIHFVCHGAAQTPVAQQIYFEEAEIVSSIQLAGNKAFREACGRNKPLIFLNACEVGRLQPALVGVGGFAQLFIERGASAVVAPLWSVKDDIAHDIAVEFYQNASDHPNKSFAAVLRDVRAKAYSGEAEDTYAAYCFYGDPLAHRAVA